MTLPPFHEGEELDPRDPLKFYGQWARRIGPQVRDALAGKIKISRQSPLTEAWIAYALYSGEGSQQTIEGIVGNADLVNHLVASAEEIAWGLLKLRSRNWLLEQESLYGLTMEGRRTIETVVVKGDLRKSWEALEKWFSAHPPPSTE